MRIRGTLLRHQLSKKYFLNFHRNGYTIINRKRGQRKWPVVAEFVVEPGTRDMLFELGAAHDSALNSFPYLPLFTSGMNAVQIKFEKGAVLSFAIGHSDEALNRFNEAIKSIRRVSG